MFFGELESHPEGHFRVPWLLDAYENRPLTNISGSWKHRCWKQAFAAWRAPNSRREGRGSDSTRQGEPIEKWSKVGDSLARLREMRAEGKGSLRRNLLFYVLNCVLQPEQQMRETAEEVLNTLGSWEKELQKIVADELHTGKTMSIPFLTVCQKYGQRKRKVVEPDLPYEVLRPPRERDIGLGTSFRSVPAGAPHRVPYARPAENRDASRAQDLRRHQGQKVYENILFKPRN